MTISKFPALLLATSAVFAATVQGAPAAHNSNNFAELTGTVAEPDATGKAIVNYSEGGGDFIGTVVVHNLVPGATYEYFLRRMAPETGTLVCAGEANSEGLLTCQAQHFVLAGFRQGAVRDAAGVVVATRRRRPPA